MFFRLTAKIKALIGHLYFDEEDIYAKGINRASEFNRRMTTATERAINELLG